MPQRLQHTPLEVPRPIFATALRSVWKSGYSSADLRADILAGLVVGVVALPLSMALAIASGVPPQHGLYTAIVAGAIIAALGGSRVQVSGPTAAFVVVLAPITAQFGLGGLMLQARASARSAHTRTTANNTRTMRFIGSYAGGTPLSRTAP